jgi:C4-dicarboxylate transporter DctM subunit
MAGVIPGLLVGLGLALAAIYASRNSQLKQLKKATPSEIWRGFKDAFWGLLMPVIILGGIYGGIFTPTEAAAVSAVYGFLVGFFIYKTLKLKEFYSILADSLAQTSIVMFIMATACLFAWVMSVEGVATASSKLLISLSDGNSIIFLLILNALLLLAGCVLDTASALYIFAPIYVPAGIALGVDPIHLGVISIINLAIGLVTPPVGVNLYMACSIGNINMKDIAKGLLPFLVSSIIVLLVVTYLPQLSLFLPGLMK